MAQGRVDLAQSFIDKMNVPKVELVVLLKALITKVGSSRWLKGMPRYQRVAEDYVNTRAIINVNPYCNSYYQPWLQQGGKNQVH